MTVGGTVGTVEAEGTVGAVGAEETTGAVVTGGAAGTVEIEGGPLERPRWGKNSVQGEEDSQMRVYEEGRKRGRVAQKETRKNARQHSEAQGLITLKC